jgi:DNA (cytosine-5)-methyltransferase 1
MSVNHKYNFIDLFAGCGGLSEGFLSSGHYNALAHIEWEKPMVDTLRNRLVAKWKHSSDDAKKRVIRFDVQKTEELLHGNWSDESVFLYGQDNSADVVKTGLDGIVGDAKVDMIIGGPPCQAYSLAGRAQDPHSMKLDYRNYLFESFVKIVDYYQPETFVFENVPGLLSACPGDTPVRIRIYEAFKRIGYDILPPDELKSAVYSSADFNTPQERNRVIIVGVKNTSRYNLSDFYSALNCAKNSHQRKTVRDAIGDMPKFEPLDEPIKEGRSNKSHRLIGDNVIPLHEARYHNKRDIEVFREWLSKNMNHFSQEEKLAYYTKVSGKQSNHIKYRSLEWDKPSPTIVSHLYKDGLMFIHPDIKQLRSITIREAALLQTFPLDFEFIGSNAYCFKMIGNAVPVEFAKGIANAMYSVMTKNKK